MRGLEISLKKKEHDIKSLSSFISDLKTTIQNLENKKNEYIMTINRLNNEKSNNLSDIQFKNYYILELLDKIEQIQKEIVRLEKQIDEQKEKLKINLGEKKAIKKYKEKLEVEKNKKEIQKETNISNEVYNFKHIYNQ